MAGLIKEAKKSTQELKRAADAGYDPAAIGGKPGVVLLDIALKDLSFNPRNPRKENIHEDPETRELAESMEEVGQLQSAVVVSRETYLKQWPEYAADIQTPWVLMIGNRRSAAAELNQWNALECVIRDRITKDLEKLGRIPMHENIHRKGINALEIAYWLADEMQLHGNNQSEVARRIRKSQPWVNQYLQLLKLIPELQDLLQADEISATTGRALAKLGEDEQRALWEHAVSLDADERSSFWAGRGAGYKQFIAPAAAPVVSDNDEAAAAESVAEPEPEPAAAQPEPAAEDEPAAARPERVRGFVFRIPDKKPTTLVTAVRELQYSRDDLIELMALLQKLMAETD